MDLRTEPVHHANLHQPVADDGEELVLRFERVSVTFEGEVQALRDVSFSLKKGHTRILLGTAGSGKSVLVKAAIGLVKPVSGNIWLFNQDITTLDEEEQFEIRSKVGILFQESALFDSLTVQENVSYPLENQRSGGKKAPVDPQKLEERVREALRFVELEQTMTRFPSELSGGMRRRVGIARAAVTDPPLMLYDSPTAGLDPITANTIVALIAKARDTRDTTSVIVTHRHQDGDIMANFCFNPESGRLDAIPRDNKIHQETIFMVFREGELVFEGTQEELEKATDPYVSKFRATRS